MQFAKAAHGDISERKIHVYTFTLKYIYTQNLFFSMIKLCTKV